MGWMGRERCTEFSEMPFVSGERATGKRNIGMTTMTSKETEFRRELAQLMRKYDVSIVSDPERERMAIYMNGEPIMRIYDPVIMHDDVYPEEGR